MAKKNAAGALKAPSVPVAFLNQILDMPSEAARSAAIDGLATFMGPQFFPTEKDSGKVLVLTREKIRALASERAEEREHELLLATVTIDSESILAALPDTVLDILTDDSTKRFVVTLRWDSEANEGGGAYVCVPSIQTARGRKAKSEE